MNKIAGYEINIEVDQRFVRENEIKLLRGSNSFLVNLIGAIEFIPIEDTLRWMFEGAAYDNACRN